MRRFITALFTPQTSRKAGYAGAALALFPLSVASLSAVEIVAHRGASYDAPENTIAATKLAWSEGADAVETDIHLTKDGKIIVSHDANTKRTTGHDAAIVDLTRTELRQLDAGAWKTAGFAGQKLPLLEEQLELIPPGRKMLVEIKVGPEIVPELARVLRAAGVGPDRVTIISFNFESLVAVRHRLPEYRTLWLVSYRKPDPVKAPDATPPPTVEEMIDRARAAGLTGLDLRHTWPLDEAAVKTIKDAGLELHVWTVNEVEIARRWIELGAASITTDRPGWLRGQLRR